MLSITIPASELYDEKTGEFIELKKDLNLKLEHSLVSISKWESKWKKPFISKDSKTATELIDYIRCMTITQNVDERYYALIDNRIIDEVTAYIDDPMTATWINEREKSSGSRRIITSELLYCWMVQLNIPWECQKWHLNRLIMLIRVINEENKPHDKKVKPDLAKRAALNKMRKAKHHTRG